MLYSWVLHTEHAAMGRRAFMGLPTVAIVGRPNVGKSSLLNALAGEMISIVEPTAGVTRDRVSTFIKREEKYFELIGDLPARAGDLAVAQCKDLLVGCAAWRDAGDAARGAARAAKALERTGRERWV